MRARFALLLIAVAAAAAAEPPPAVLPPEDLARQALAGTPRVQAAQDRLREERALSDRLAAGPYEWSAGLTLNNRHVEDGRNYVEPTVSLNRGIRWNGKAAKDREIGALGVEAGGLAVADAWHESGRSLLMRWFNAVRAAQGVRRLRAEVQLAQQQYEASAAMAVPGEIPRLDAMLAKADLDKLRAQQQQAELAADAAAAELAYYYPGLPPPADAPMPEPPLLAGDAQEWVRRIVGDNHEIELAQAEAKRGNSQAERAGLDRVPDPTVGALYWMERNGQDRITGLQLSIPIPGRERRAAYGQARAKADGLQEAARETEMRVGLAAHQAVQQARLAPEIWKRLADVAQQAAANARLAFEAYRLGETGLNEVLTARRQAAATSEAADSAAADAWEARSRLLLDSHQLWAYDEAGAAAPPGAP